MTKAQQKKNDARINKAYLTSCENVQVPILDIPKIFAVGHQAIAEGADDETLKHKIFAFVQTIRTN